jgi:hypothetical protein
MVSHAKTQRRKDAKTQRNVFVKASGGHVMYSLLFSK